MAIQFRPQLAGILGRIRRDFLTGILVLVPLGATLLIFKWLFDAIDGILEPAVEAIFGRPIAGIGFGAIIVLIFLVGIFASNFVGRKIIQRIEALVEELPMVREIYNTFKQILQSVILPHKGGFREVVLVEFPRPGMKTIGFVTNRIKDAAGNKLVSIYIPTTPNPTSGYLEIIPEEDVVLIDMAIDDAIKMVVSGGMVSPEVIDKRKSRS
ncbi:MAG: DUF502 domain-containing protein [Dehalococcoidia bacterium]|nr:MAG: DUF502 domain-containing protein [Dehalococcoidia bacterium]